MVSFALKNLFSPIRSHLLIVHLSARAITVLFRFLSCANEFKAVSNVSSIWFSISDFMLRTWTWVLCSVIHMDVFALFYMQTSSFKSPICWRCWLFPSAYSDFIKNQMSLLVWFNVWVFNLIKWIYKSLFMLKLAVFITWLYFTNRNHEW